MLNCQRHLFSLPADVHYINCAFMAPLLRPAEDAGVGGIRRRRVPAGITPADFWTDADRVRELFGTLVNAPAARVALVPAASYGLAAAARNLRPTQGQNIVLAAGQFPRNVYSWRRLAAEQELEIRTVAPPEAPACRGSGWNERLLEAIDDSTAVVALGHVHWADGTLFDLETIGTRSREAGAALIIDGTQSVGALPFDVQRVQPDALICAGYKWLLGPYGMGAAYYGPRFDGGVPLEENWIARAGSDDFSGLVDYRDEYAAGAVRYDVGERSNPILLPMLAAALEQILEWRPERIQDYCRRLLQDTINEAREMGYMIAPEDSRAAHLLGFRLPPSVELSRLAAALRERYVSVAVRGDAVRVSPHVYNNEADAAALLDALRVAR
jgi:selenocysteine lyase/cysteine desulfurase